MRAHIIACDLIRTYSGHVLNISNYINLILILNVFLTNVKNENILNVISNAKGFVFISSEL